MEVLTTELKSVLLIQPDIFEDHRGEYSMTFNKNLYAEKGIKIEFVEDDISVSSKHVLRGIHGDDETWKLISCLYGKFYFVVVNCDQNNPNFGQWQAFTISDHNRKQVLIPPKHGNGHVVLSDNAIFHYKQSQYYNPKGQFTYKWDNPNFNIWWPIKNPILSERDEIGNYVTRY